MATLKDIRIIVIDDDSMLRTLMGSILRAEGFGVSGEASNADQGLKLAQTVKPHLILLDINLPGRDGMDLLPELLGLESRPKVIMVSGEATLERVKGALGLGANGFVVKPINPNKLLSAIAFALKAS